MDGEDEDLKCSLGQGQGSNIEEISPVEKWLNESTIHLMWELEEAIRQRIVNSTSLQRPFSPLI